MPWWRYSCVTYLQSSKELKVSENSFFIRDELTRIAPLQDIREAWTWICRTEASVRRRDCSCQQLFSWYWRFPVTGRLKIWIAARCGDCKTCRDSFSANKESNFPCSIWCNGESGANALINSPRKWGRCNIRIFIRICHGDTDCWGAGYVVVSICSGNRKVKYVIGSGI